MCVFTYTRSHDSIAYTRKSRINNQHSLVYTTQRMLYTYTNSFEENGVYIHKFF